TAAIGKILTENHGYAMREAQTPAERELLWAGRKGAIGALGRIKPNYYLHDGVVPRSRLPQVLSAVGEIDEHYKLPVANVFHSRNGVHVDGGDGLDIEAEWWCAPSRSRGHRPQTSARAGCTTRRARSWRLSRSAVAGRAEWAEPPNVSTSSYIRRGSTA